MTCRLDRRNPLDALYDRAKKYPGGIEALAQRMGTSASVLYKKLEQTNETHHLRADEFEDAIRLIDAARVPDAFAPLRALCWRFDHVAVQLPTVTDGQAAELASRVVNVLAEAGDVARAYFVVRCTAS